MHPPDEIELFLKISRNRLRYGLGKGLLAMSTRDNVEPSRRSVLSLLLVGGILPLSGCDEQEVVPLQYRQRLEDQAKALREAIEALASEIDNFDTDNWREVVPDVQEGIRTVLDELKTLEETIEPPDSE